MAVAKSRPGTTHVLASCCGCDKQWDDYRSADDSARQHAEQTGHRVKVERAQVWTYNPNSTAF